MKLSRRDFIHGGCTIGLATFAYSALDSARAGLIHRSAASNTNRASINAVALFQNLAKSFNFPSQDPTTVSSDGYPLSTPASVIASNPSMPPNYYGTYTWSWSGQGSMQIPSVAIVVTSGGTAITEIGSNSGDASGNVTLLSQSNPSVVFAFGFNIQSIQNNGSGVIQINTKSNFVTGAGSGSANGQLINISGANANTGANGTWIIANRSASSFELQGSTFTNAQASPAGQAIFTGSNLSVRFHNAGTYGSGGTQMSNLVWCRTADVASIAAGQIIDATYIAQLKYLFNNNGAANANLGWLRFMDLIGVQASFECDFSQRISSTYVTYPQSGGSFRPGYWAGAGAVTNTADALTCSDPSVSVWNGSSYIDNAIVQGTISATNAGGTPTLAVGGHAAKPIFNYADGTPVIILGLTGGSPAPGTDVLQYTFSATWLNGGTPYVFSYATIAGDSVQATLNSHLEAALSADATLASASIFTSNPLNGGGNAGPFIFPRTAQAGRLAVSYTSGPAISVISNCLPARITAAKGTFVYNYLLDGWIYRNGGMLCSSPFEAIVQMCNQAGAHCWFNLPFTKAQWITAVTNFFGDSVTGLSSGLRFGNEAWNEVWNSSANPFSLLQACGNALGFKSSSFTSNFSYTALRTIQYAALAKLAWTGKGRSASDFYILQQTQGANLSIGGNFDKNCLTGFFLDAAGNTIYATYGGLNGGSAPSYNAAPTRPVDITNAIGIAPYWNSAWLGSGSFTTSANFNGTATQNSDILTAAKNFATGSVSTAFASLVNEFNGTTTKSGGSTGGANLSNIGNNWQALMSQIEAMCAQYDGAGRITAGLPALGQIHYEGGPSFGVGSNGNNGVNSLTFNTVLTVDITALAGRMTTLDSPVGSFDCSPYTVSATDNKTEMATMVLQMLQAWKFDVDNSGNAANTGSYKGLIKTSYYQALKTISGANRETKPCQYGYAGSNWGVWPATPFDLASYKNYDAIHEWNAGG